MKIWEFEDQLWNRDGVRVVIRAPSWALIVVPSTQTNAADRNMSATQFLRTRVQPHVGDYEHFVIDGSGSVTHGRTKLEKIRGSYSR